METSDDLESEWKSWQESGQDKRKLRSLVTKLDPVISSTLSSAGIKSPVVHDRAKITAAKALKSYDPSRGAKLSTFVSSQLRSVIRDAPKIQEPFIPGERYRRELNDLHRAELEFTDKFGRDATDEELAEVTQIPLRKLVRIRSARRARIPMSVVEDADEDSNQPDVIGSTRTHYDDWVDAVYHGLGDIDKLILMHRTGYRNAEVLDVGGLSQRTGLTPEAVRARAHRIQAQLDSFHGRGT